MFKNCSKCGGARKEYSEPMRQWFKCDKCDGRGRIEDEELMLKKIESADDVEEQVKRGRGRPALS